MYTHIYTCTSVHADIQTQKRIRNKCDLINLWVVSMDRFSFCCPKCFCCVCCCRDVTEVKVLQCTVSPYYEWLASECEINDALKWKQHVVVVAAAGGVTSLGHFNYSSILWVNLVFWLLNLNLQEKLNKYSWANINTEVTLTQIEFFIFII